MVINNTYFKSEIYLPHAKPGITDNVTSVDAEIIDFIYDYSRECLLYSLGPSLFLLFETELDPTQPNGLKTTSDIKWDRLLNGYNYIDSSGNQQIFRGIRFKNNPAGEYNKSFLANYVYFFYQSDSYVQTTGTGDVSPKVKSGEVINPSSKVIKAWNKFVDLVQGSEIKPKYYNTEKGFGVDYYKGNNETSMYKFIKDMNELDETTYPGFKPKTFVKLNQYGI